MRKSQVESFAKNDILLLRNLQNLMKLREGNLFADALILELATQERFLSFSWSLNHFLMFDTSPYLFQI